MASTRAAALLVGATLAWATTMGAAPAHAAGATIVATPSTVTNLQTISVSGNAGGPGAPDLYVAVCEGTPTASNCDTNLAGIGTSTAHFVQVPVNQSTGAWGPVSFYLRQTLKTGHTPAGFLCTTTCVIGTTDAFDPSIHTYDSTTPLTFVGATATSTSTSASTTTSAPSTMPPATSSATGTSTKTTAPTGHPSSTAAGSDGGDGETDGGSTGAALADTGGTPVTPVLAGAALALLLAGLTLRVAAGRRGSRA